jgi:two-component system, LytTR family, sensor kinase
MGDAIRGWTARQWAATFGGALSATLIVSLRNYVAYRMSGRPAAFGGVFIAELPVWIGWAIVLPVIVHLARRYPPFGRHVARNAVIHFITGLTISACIIVATTLLRSALGTPGAIPAGLPYVRTLGSILLATTFAFLFVYGTIAGLAMAWSYSMEQREEQAHRSQLEALLANSQRDLLRAQLHPHFLFNTLHAISALMSRDVPAARRMISRLSDLLRLSLDNDAQHEVTLDEELEFLSRYLDIQLVRFGDRMAVRYEIEEGTRRMLVPRLMLQILVENAIIHGLEQMRRHGEIVIRSRLRGNDLIVTVTDNGQGLSPEPSPGTGVGLANSRARLRELYGDRAELTLESVDGGGAEACLRIPAREHRTSSMGEQ